MQNKKIPRLKHLKEKFENIVHEINELGLSVDSMNEVIVLDSKLKDLRDLVKVLDKGTTVLLAGDIEDNHMLPVNIMIELKMVTIHMVEKEIDNIEEKISSLLSEEVDENMAMIRKKIESIVSENVAIFNFIFDKDYKFTVTSGMLNDLSGEFNISIPQKAYGEWKSIDDIVKYVIEKITEKGESHE
jgi:hypothetical protein